MERLQKVIANSGYCSRRKAEEYIRNGDVTVNGKVVRELGTLIDSTAATIKVRSTVLEVSAPLVYALNKPKGVVCSLLKQGSAQIVTDLLPKNTPVKPVGRLDKDSEGLLILTNNGNLAHQLTHPSFGHEKEYEVTCQAVADLTNEQVDRIIRKLHKGVHLGDGRASADTVRILEQVGNQLVLRITVHEGRQHLIRRMCATVDLKVKRLKRVRIGKFWLGNLKAGQYRSLSKHEQSLLS